MDELIKTLEIDGRPVPDKFISVFNDYLKEVLIKKDKEIKELKAAFKLACEYTESEFGEPGNGDKYDENYFLNQVRRKQNENKNKEN